MSEENVGQIVDQALRFADTHRNAAAWAEWAHNLTPESRAVFEAIRESTIQSQTADPTVPRSETGRPGVPTLAGLSHELRAMLYEAFRVWGLPPP